MKTKIIAQGAEALIEKKENEIIKNRIKKSYRIPELDEKLRKQRTKRESSLLERAGKFTNTPKILKTDKFHIHMEFLEGDKLSQTLNSYPEKKQLEIMHQLGEEVAKLHNADIIHGDLTTSNTILVENRKKKKENKIEKDSASHDNINSSDKLIKTNNRSAEQETFTNKSKFQIFIIDFGLGFISKRIEDKAVDLHLIKQALEAKHYLYHESLFHSFLQGYKLEKDYAKILEQLKKVEARGRYKKFS